MSSKSYQIINELNFSDIDIDGFDLLQIEIAKFSEFCLNLNSA